MGDRVKIVIILHVGLMFGIGFDRMERAAYLMLGFVRIEFNPKGKKWFEFYNCFKLDR